MKSSELPTYPNRISKRSALLTSQLALAFITLSWLFISLSACTSAHSVRSIGKGNIGLEASLGGPFITNLGPPLLTPNLYLGARYGIRDDMDVSAHYNLTGPFVPGIGLNLINSFHWVPIQPGLGFQESTPKKGWALANSFSLHTITDFKSGFIAVPVFDVAGGWRYKWFNPFIGVSLGLNFYRPFDKQNIAQVNPYLGVDFIIDQKKSISVKLIFYDVAYNLYGSQIKWIYLRNDLSAKKKYGVVGLSIGFSWDCRSES